MIFSIIVATIVASLALSSNATEQADFEFDGCVIDGQMVNRGQQQPSNRCKACDPSVSKTEYSNWDPAPLVIMISDKERETFCDGNKGGCPNKPNAYGHAQFGFDPKCIEETDDVILTEAVCENGQWVATRARPRGYAIPSSPYSCSVDLCDGTGRIMKDAAKPNGVSCLSHLHDADQLTPRIVDGHFIDAPTLSCLEPIKGVCQDGVCAVGANHEPVVFKPDGTVCADTGACGATKACLKGSCVQSIPDRPDVFCPHKSCHKPVSCKPEVSFLTEGGQSMEPACEYEQIEDGNGCIDRYGYTALFGYCESGECKYTASWISQISRDVL